MFSSVWTDSGKSQKLSKEVRERISLKDLCLEGCRIKVLKCWGVKTLIEAKQSHLLGGSGAKVTECLRHWRHMLRDTPGKESIAPNRETKGTSKAPKIRAQ